MDKKELQNLIDRISLTGPEGIKKIKKVLKELSDSSSSSMGEDEEYTIAQALNDLNERIEELQSQLELAQAPATKIFVNDVTSGEYESENAALSRLSINGETPTKQQLIELSEKLPNVVLTNQYSDTTHTDAPITYFYANSNRVEINGGYYLNEDYYFVFRIIIDGNESKIDMVTV